MSKWIRRAEQLEKGGELINVIGKFILATILLIVLGLWITFCVGPCVVAYLVPSSP